MLQDLIELIKLITPVENSWLNTLIQTLIFEAVMVLIIPLIGILINSVIVKGIRRIIASIIGCRLEFIISNYLFAIGVVIHELSHALFAFVTGAKITEIALFKPDDNSLGHVCYVPRGPALFRALQNSLSSCAPVVTGLILSTLMVIKLFPALTVTWQWVLTIYLLASIVFHMTMSGADLKNYFRGVGVLLLFALPFCFVFLMFS